ncbi:hypothetical protein BC936DRAFT_149666, partial [Jimgerdemannia flammicorona]
TADDTKCDGLVREQKVSLGSADVVLAPVSGNANGFNRWSVGKSTEHLTCVIGDLAKARLTCYTRRQTRTSIQLFPSSKSRLSFLIRHKKPSPLSAGLHLFRPAFTSFGLHLIRHQKVCVRATIRSTFSTAAFSPSKSPTNCSQTQTTFPDPSPHSPSPHSPPEGVCPHNNKERFQCGGILSFQISRQLHPFANSHYFSQPSFSLRLIRPCSLYLPRATQAERRRTLWTRNRQLKISPASHNRRNRNTPRQNTRHLLTRHTRRPNTNPAHADPPIAVRASLAQIVVNMA